MAAPLLYAPALLSAGVGLAQTIKGLSMDEGERPEFDIPDSAQEALANARYQASQTKLPGVDTTRDILREDAANAIFNATRAATSPGQILSAVSGVNEALNKSEMNLAVQGAQRYDQNQGMLRGELNKMAGWEQMDWIQDEWNPYMQNLQRKQSLLSGGLNNIMSGVNMLPGAAGGANYLNTLAGDKDIDPDAGDDSASVQRNQPISIAPLSTTPPSGSGPFDFRIDEPMFNPTPISNVQKPKAPFSPTRNYIQNSLNTVTN